MQFESIEKITGYVGDIQLFDWKRTIMLLLTNEVKMMMSDEEIEAIPETFKL
jgi:hypothetical protein